ncbi:MAG: hypothetical protein ACRYG8_51520 [Janthinobacterium lividum]
MWRATLHHFTCRSIVHFMAHADETPVSEWRLVHRVALGHDAWIGHVAILLPGVSMGIGTIVCAGAVVTRSVADHTIVAGDPARPIRRRVTEPVEAALKRLAWWNRSRPRLIAALADFQTLNAAAFAARHDPETDCERTERYCIG